MSELTKLAEIIAKHLSDAFLSMASDFAKLNNAAPLSQTSEKQELVSIRPTLHKLLWAYKPRTKVIVRPPNSESSIKMRILKNFQTLNTLCITKEG